MLINLITNLLQWNKLFCIQVRNKEYEFTFKKTNLDQTWLKHGIGSRYHIPF